MERNTEPLLNELLVDWHRWAHAPARRDDSRLRDFDAVVSHLSPSQRAALVVQARNLACGAAVWSSARVPRDAIAQARTVLMAVLSVDTARWFGKRTVHLNERGNRIGESNPRAQLTDREVELLLELREEKDDMGKPKHSYSWLAEKFECSKSAVQWYCNGGRRSQPVARVKVVA